MGRSQVIRRLRIGVLALGLLVISGLPSQAEVPVGGSKQVTVTVLAIQATEGPGRIDPQLKGLADKLKKAVPFESFRLLSRQSRRGPLGRKQVFALPEKMELVVTPLEERDGAIRLSVLLLRPRPNAPPTARKQTVLNMNVTLPRKQGFPIAGPALKEGVLVLVVSAE